MNRESMFVNRESSVKSGVNRKPQSINRPPTHPNEPQIHDSRFTIYDSRPSLLLALVRDQACKCRRSYNLRSVNVQPFDGVAKTFFRLERLDVQHLVHDTRSPSRGRR